MKQKTQTSSLINIITVILVVGAVAWGVVKIKSQWTDAKPDTEQQVDESESKSVDAAPEDKEADAVVEKAPAPAENVEEAAAEVEEEKEADAPHTQDQTDEPALEQDKPTAETVKKPQQSFDMRNMLAGLNLTDAEKGRLRQGFALAMQKRQNMTPEERQVERAKFQTMRARWEGMSPDEQQETMQRMRGRFEDWRQSDAIELPELSLD